MIFQSGTSLRPLIYKPLKSGHRNALLPHLKSWINFGRSGLTSGVFLIKAATTRMDYTPKFYRISLTRQLHFYPIGRTSVPPVQTNPLSAMKLYEGFHLLFSVG